MTIDARTGTQHLSRAECLSRLADDVVGRLAVMDGGTPVILPVNYALDGDSIVFRTGKGLKLQVAMRSAASFEIDQIDRNERTGWSVVVTGVLEEITDYDAATWQRALSLPVEPWAPGRKDHWLRLVPRRITGRRVSPLPA